MKEDSKELWRCVTGRAQTLCMGDCHMLQHSGSKSILQALSTLVISVTVVFVIKVGVYSFHTTSC